MSDNEDGKDEISASNDCSSSSSPPQTDVEELRKKLKSPDSRKFERELEKLNTAIREKEAKFRSYPKSSRSQAEGSHSSGHHAFKDRDTLMCELRGYKAEREKEIETRKKIDQELKAASALVQSKTEACGKLQAGLKYKTESKVEEAIRRLEHQMRAQQLKLREEKRIVTEIDALKRSKKLIHDFDFLKNEIGQLRDKQHLLRTKRDGCMRTIQGLKSKEEQVKTSLDEQRHKADEARHQQKEYITEKNALKKEIDELYDKKRALVAAFNKEKDEYHNILRDIKFQERQIRRDMEIATKSESGHSQKSKQYKDNEQRSMISTHKKMLDLCDTLVNYFEKINIETCSKPDYDSPTLQEQSQEVQGAIASFKGGTFLKKKNDDDLEGMYGGSNKKLNRRNSKKSRRSTQKENVPKKLVLHPLVLEQCLSLYITPPSSASDIPKALELLHEKKAVLSTVLENPDIVSRSRDSESSATSGVEDFPSLPSQTSVEQDTLSTISSTDDSVVNSENAKPAPATVGQDTLPTISSTDDSVANSENTKPAPATVEQDTLPTISSTDDSIVTSENAKQAPATVEQETLSTISSTNDSVANSENAKPAPATVEQDPLVETKAESKNIIASDSKGQEQIKNADGSDKVLKNNTKNQEPIELAEGDLKSCLNGDQESVPENVKESGPNVRKDSESNLNNGIGNGIPSQHMAEINDMQDDEEESVKENHIKNDENLINEQNTAKLMKFEVKLSDQNNADYISNEIRNSDTQDDNPKLCSQQVLPQQISDQDSERAIDCPS